MAKRAVKTGKRTLDPMFFVPDGVSDYEYSDKELQLQVDENESGDYFDGDDDNDYSDTPPTPTILDVVWPHTIHTMPDGTQLVDVTIIVDDIPDAKYEIRVAKID